MSTSPETSVLLQVPQTPSPQDDGSVTPASAAAVRIEVPASQEIVRAERRSSMECAPVSG
jgi:hypothetical protein